MDQKILKKNRNIYIDVLKSFLIISVVIGHTIVSFFPERYIYNNIFKVIYSFHMFLFIFVSAYLVKLVGHEINILWLKKRFFRLMIPYIVWTALLLVIRNNFSLYNYLGELIKPSCWFLIILFLYDATYYLLNIITNNINKQMKIIVLYIICIIFIWFISKNLIKNTEILHLYSIYLFEYFAGIFAYTFKDKLLNIIKKYQYIIILLYPISMIVYTYKDHSVFISTIQWIILDVSIYDISNNFLSMMSVVYNHYIVAPLGLMFWGLVVWYFYKLGILGNKFSLVGKYTLSIYLMSSIFNFHYLNIKNLDILISIFLGIFLPIIFEYIIKKFPKIHYILFGSYK